MDKLKLAIFDHVGNKSGMDYYDDSLMNALSKNDCDTLIFSNYIGKYNKIDYISLYQGFTDNNNIIKFFKLLSATLKSSRIAKKRNIDLVILHVFSTSIVSLFLTLLPKLLNLKIAIIAHDVSSFTKDDNSLIQYIVYNWFTDFIIVHNKYSYEMLLSNTNIKNLDKIHIIKHGGYLDQIGNLNMDKLTVRVELGLDPKKKYLLFFGQIKDTKGLDILLNAMPNIDKDIHLIIAGKPWKNDFSTYDLLIDNNKLNDRIIKKLRFIEDDERDKLFFTADLMVIPYKIIYQSGVLLMSMSYGLPVLASNLEANMGIISHGKNGLLFKSEHINDLSFKINKYINNEEKLSKISTNSIQTIKDKYSWDKIALEYLKMIKQ